MFRRPYQMQSQRIGLALEHTDAAPHTFFRIDRSLVFLRALWLHHLYGIEWAPLGAILAPIAKVLSNPGFVPAPGNAFGHWHLKSVQGLVDHAAVGTAVAHSPARSHARRVLAGMNQSECLTFVNQGHSFIRRDSLARVAAY